MVKERAARTIKKGARNASYMVSDQGVHEVRKCGGARSLKGKKRERASPSPEWGKTVAFVGGQRLCHDITNFEENRRELASAEKIPSLFGEESKGEK